MIKAENKRGVTTLNPEQQAALKRLSKKYVLSESKILAHAFDLLVRQEAAHFDVGLKKVSAPH
ncbi:hypothetical protein [Enterococcus faecium]|uniref:Uncharacterized protein n=1 Tax=Enterococcus faecium TaxID=1352 RepID=A0A242BDT6_ENTFC|nr:hypothetical protein [Enterococcus faecium]OTN93665.1 hypothetical protein A5810_001541 [Enterococcus faecium]